MGLKFDWNQWQRFPQVLPWWQLGLMIGAVFLAIWLIVLLRSYFREDSDDADQPLEMLTQFRDLHQQGGLSDDEFRLIRSRLAKSAQMARVTGRTGQKTKLVDRNLAKSANAPTTISSETPETSVTHSTAKDEANSERMTEESTD